MSDELHRPAPVTCLAGEINVGDIFVLVKDNGPVRLTVTKIVETPTEYWPTGISIWFSGDNGNSFLYRCLPSSEVTLPREEERA